MRTPKAPEPTTERQVVPGELRGEFETRVPEGAFGGISKENLREERANSDLIMRAEEQGDKLNVTQAKNYILEQNSNFMPRALNAKGEDAVKYSPFVKDNLTDPYWKNTVGKALSMGQNDKQKSEIQQFADKLTPAMNRQIQTNIVKQNFKTTGKNLISNTELLLGQLPNFYDNPTARDQYLKDIHDSVVSASKWMGYGPEDDATKLNIESTLNTAHTMIVKSYLRDQNIAGAKGYVDGLKKQGYTNEKLLNLQTTVDKAATIQDAYNNWDRNWKYQTDQAGYPITDAIVSKIQGNPNLTDGQKTAQIKVATTLAGKARVDLDRKKADTLKSFEDQADKIMQSKNPDMKSVNALIQSQVPGHQQELAEKYIRDTYGDRAGITINIKGGASKNDLQLVKPNVYDAIQDGRLIDSNVLDNLAKQGYLNYKDYRFALDMLNKQAKGGPSAEVNFTRNQIRRMAMDVLPDKSSVSVFMGNLAENTQGMKPTEMMEWAKKNGLEPEAKNPSAFWDRITGNKDAQFDNETLKDDQDLMKSLNFEVGKEPINSILSSLATPQNPRPSLNDMEGFLHELGDVPLSEIGRGKPMNNAMQSIINWNRTADPSKIIPFTPQAIRALAEKNNGYF